MQIRDATITYSVSYMNTGCLNALIVILNLSLVSESVCCKIRKLQTKPMIVKIRESPFPLNYEINLKDI
jgi:hypothetical protein